MNSLMNYGSDDDCEGSGDEKYIEPYGGGTSRNYRKSTVAKQEDVNYDNVEMDMSEDSSNDGEPPKKHEGKEDRRPSGGFHERDSPKHSNRDREETDRRRDDRYTSSWRDRSKTNRREDKDEAKERSRDRGRAEKDADRDRGRDRVREEKEVDRDRGRDRFKDDKDGDKYRKERYRDKGDKDDDRKDRYRDREDKDGERRDRYRDDRRDRRDDRSREDRYAPKDKKERIRSRSRDRKSRSPPPAKRSRSRSKERGPKGGFSRRYERANNKMDKLGKMGIEIKTPDCQYITPADLKNSMSEEKDTQNKDRFFMPGITGRFRDQIEKRKMLWQKGKEPEANQSIKPVALGNFAPGINNAAGGSKATKVYEATTFADDKTSSKFKRLMGIRDSGDAVKNANDVLKKQEEMFSTMEQQYEVARTATHTMRGVGLGFGSFQR